MELHRIVLGLLVGLGTVFSSEAYKFHVGGKEGWVENPKEAYNQWAGRTRFSVNDTLYFKYKKGDSVLLVSQDDYYKCNPNNPIEKWTGGPSEFTLDRSGPFFFIGGTRERCSKGQHLNVVVLAVRTHPTTPSPQPTPPQPPATTPAPSPTPVPKHAPAPAPAPAHHSSAWSVGPATAWVLAGTILLGGVVLY